MLSEQEWQLVLAGQGAVASRPCGVDLQLTEAASPGMQPSAALRAACCCLHGHGAAFKVNRAVAFGGTIKIKPATDNGFLVSCHRSVRINPERGSSLPSEMYVSFALRELWASLKEEHGPFTY